MCGIAGFIGRKKLEEGRLQDTLTLMQNRGPDASDYTTFEEGDINVHLLHSRLSIIDLDPRSNQPYTIGDYTIVFNGEIYNYVELRNKLQQDNVQLNTSSDTEVLLHYYIQYGEDCVDHFEGMWAFAIYDKKRKKLFLSRDRFAEKPLYYIQTEEGYYFGSEIKFIRKLYDKPLTVNDNHMLRYLVNGYKSLYKGDEHYFNEIKEVPFAGNMIVDHELRRKVTKYWHPDFTPAQMTQEEAIEGFKHHLIESMKLRLRSDVPIAFCLSGGVDSSSLVSIAAKEFNVDAHTFSIIDPDERYNELDNINATVNDLGCKNTIINLDTEGTLDRMKDLIAYHDVPVATITFFVHSFITQSVAENGYKVVMAGHAADEMATGYYDHHNLFLNEVRNHPDYETFLNDWKNNTGKFVRNPHLQNPELYADNRNFRGHIYLNNDVFRSLVNIPFYEDFTETKYCDQLLRNRMLNELFHEGVRLILHEDDLNSMKYSIENRCPFLDSKLFDFAYSIPVEYMMKDGYAKYILRESVNGILNDQVRLDRQKKGFNASINSIIDLNDKKNIEYLMEDGPVFKYINRDKIADIFNKGELTNSYSKYIFNFLNAKIFLEQNA